MKKLDVKTTRWFHPEKGIGDPVPTDRLEETRAFLNETNERLDRVEEMLRKWHDTQVTKEWKA